MVEEKPTYQIKKNFTKVIPSEYEHGDRNTKKYWMEFFNKFDQEFAEKRKEFPDDIAISSSLEYDEVAEKVGLPRIPTVYRDSSSVSTLLTCDLKNLRSCFYEKGDGKRKSQDLSEAYIYIAPSFEEKPVLPARKPKFRPGLRESRMHTFNIDSVGKKLSFSQEIESFVDEGSQVDDSELDDLRVLVDVQDLKERSKVEMSRMKFHIPGKARKKYLSKKQKQYLKFLRSRPKKAARWRTQETLPEELNEMSLPEKAAYIEDMVASEFCGWLDSLGGRKSDLNAETLKELFEIGLTNPASRAIKSCCAELICAPDGVAVAEDIQLDSFRSKLRQLLHCDLKAREIPRKKVAFGRTLPLKDRTLPCDSNVKEWLECKTVSPDLVDFSLTFSDILHRHSVDAYCHYLLKNSNSLKPGLLVKLKMFDRIQSSAHANCPHSRFY